MSVGFRSSFARRGLGLLLTLLALLLARQLVLVHGVAHASGLKAAPELTWAAGHEQGDSLCQALDELGGGDAPLPTVELSVQQEPASVKPMLAQAQCLATGLWRASARGPPQA